ncbi:unnamed protein product [Paramecium sonneborni]|uniref:Uncharacterized protein n=1 Tax=Paramecium sonneborni TaxID=65129 RepID=A0A8S1QLG1_9CILI|nr:unnamed protein product [Paramecium sonneborni]
MFKSKMIENEKTLQCCLKHQLPIVSVILNPQLLKLQRLLCNQCSNNVDTLANVVSFEKIIQMIEQQQNQKLHLIETMIIQNIKKIESFQNLIIQMKSNIIQQLEQLNKILKDWITNLKSIGVKHSQYSFHEELENIINKNNNMKFNSNSFIKDISIENNNRNSQAKPKLEQYNQFPEYNECNQILLDLQVDILKLELFENLNENSMNINNESEGNIQVVQVPYLEEEDIKLQLIHQSVLQEDYCFSIVFNSSSTIMVSTDKKVIKVWNFNDERIKLQQTFEQHKDWKENFWTYSQAYSQHTNSVNCMILNENEDQLFSGGDDQSIKVWSLDFRNGKLIYQYSLDKHINRVCALSLNQSESLLVSCGNSKNETIIWEKGIQDKMEFKYVVKQSVSCGGKKVKFIKDNQFIWVPCVKEIDKIFIFELMEGVFQKNQQKTIQLNQYEDEGDYYLFPIIYNKQKNVIIVRHKCYIYLIRELNNGQFKIVEQLKFKTNYIYGTISNNGSYLVYWDNQNWFYSTYELFYQRLNYQINHIFVLQYIYNFQNDQSLLMIKLTIKLRKTLELNCHFEFYQFNKLCFIRIRSKKRILNLFSICLKSTFIKSIAESLTLVVEQILYNFLRILKY